MDQRHPNSTPQTPDSRRLSAILDQAKRLKDMLGDQFVGPDKELAERLADQYLEVSGFSPAALRIVRPNGLSLEETGLLAKLHLSHRVVQFFGSDITGADAFLRSKGLEESKRADIIFDAIVRLVRRFPEFECIEEKQGFFRKILNETMHDYFEREKRYKLMVERYRQSVASGKLSVIAQGLAALEAEEACELLYETILDTGLAPMAQVSFLLKYGMRWSSKELAEALDDTESAVDTRNTRTRRRIKQLLPPLASADIFLALDGPTQRHSMKLEQVVVRSRQLENVKERAALEMYAYFEMDAETLEEVLGVRAERTIHLATAKDEPTGDRPAAAGKEGFNG